MKKIRVSLKRSCKEWSIPIFDSSESAYYLKDDPCPEELEDCCKIISLKQGEFLEVEWMGFEAVYDDEIKNSSHYIPSMSTNCEKFESVRVAKMTKIKNSSYKTGYIETFTGWVMPGLFDSISSNKDDIRVVQIKGKTISKIDFSQLFLETSETKENKDPESDRKVSTFDSSANKFIN